MLSSFFCTVHRNAINAGIVAGLRVAFILDDLGIKRRYVLRFRRPTTRSLCAHWSEPSRPLLLFPAFRRKLGFFSTSSIGLSPRPLLVDLIHPVAYEFRAANHYQLGDVSLSSIDCLDVANRAFRAKAEPFSSLSHEL